MNHFFWDEGDRTSTESEHPSDNIFTLYGRAEKDSKSYGGYQKGDSGGNAAFLQPSRDRSISCVARKRSEPDGSTYQSLENQGKDKPLGPSKMDKMDAAASVTGKYELAACAHRQGSHLMMRKKANPTIRQKSLTRT